MGNAFNVCSTVSLGRGVASTRITGGAIVVGGTEKTAVLPEVT